MAPTPRQRATIKPTCPYIFPPKPEQYDLDLLSCVCCRETFSSHSDAYAHASTDPHIANIRSRQHLFTTRMSFLSLDPTQVTKVPALTVMNTLLRPDIKLAEINSNGKPTASDVFDFQIMYFHHFIYAQHYTLLAQRLAQPPSEWDTRLITGPSGEKREPTTFDSNFDFTYFDHPATESNVAVLLALPSPDRLWDLIVSVDLAVVEYNESISRLNPRDVGLLNSRFKIGTYPVGPFPTSLARPERLTIFDALTRLHSPDHSKALNPYPTRNRNSTSYPDKPKYVDSDDIISGDDNEDENTEDEDEIEKPPRRRAGRPRGGKTALAKNSRVSTRRSRSNADDEDAGDDKNDHSSGGDVDEKPRGRGRYIRKKAETNIEIPSVPSNDSNSNPKEDDSSSSEVEEEKPRRRGRWANTRKKVDLVANEGEKKPRRGRARPIDPVTGEPTPKRRYVRKVPLPSRKSSPQTRRKQLSSQTLPEKTSVYPFEPSTIPLPFNKIGTNNGMVIQQASITSTAETPVVTDTPYLPSHHFNPNINLYNFPLFCPSCNKIVHYQSKVFEHVASNEHVGIILSKPTLLQSKHQYNQLYFDPLTAAATTSAATPAPTRGRTRSIDPSKAKDKDSISTVLSFDQNFLLFHHYVQLYAVSEELGTTSLNYYATDNGYKARFKNQSEKEKIFRLPELPQLSLLLEELDTSMIGDSTPVLAPNPLAPISSHPILYTNPIVAPFIARFEEEMVRSGVFIERDSSDESSNESGSSDEDDSQTDKDDENTGNNNNNNDEEEETKPRRRGRKPMAGRRRRREENVEEDDSSENTEEEGSTKKRARRRGPAASRSTRGRGRWGPRREENDVEEDENELVQLGGSPAVAHTPPTTAPTRGRGRWANHIPKSSREPARQSHVYGPNHPLSQESQQRNYSTRLYRQHELTHPASLSHNMSHMKDYSHFLHDLSTGGYELLFAQLEDLRVSPHISDKRAPLLLINTPTLNDNAEDNNNTTNSSSELVMRAQAQGPSYNPDLDAQNVLESEALLEKILQQSREKEAAEMKKKMEKRSEELLAANLFGPEIKSMMEFNNKQQQHQQDNFLNEINKNNSNAMGNKSESFLGSSSAGVGNNSSCRPSSLPLLFSSSGPAHPTTGMDPALEAIRYRIVKERSQFNLTRSFLSLPTTTADNNNPVNPSISSTSADLMISKMMEQFKEQMQLTHEHYNSTINTVLANHSKEMADMKGMIVETSALHQAQIQRLVSVNQTLLDLLAKQTSSANTEVE